MTGAVLRHCPQPSGHLVYHASYVAFYERARTEMLRHHHF
ncbi:hypothetical protein V7P28_03880, partial [Klebsiella michiganensis]